MSLFAIVLTPFLGAALVAWASRLGRAAAAWCAGLVGLLAAVLLATAMPPPSRRSPVSDADR